MQLPGGYLLKIVNDDGVFKLSKIEIPITLSTLFSHVGSDVFLDLSGCGLCSWVSGGESGLTNPYCDSGAESQSGNRVVGWAHPRLRRQGMARRWTGVGDMRVRFGDQVNHLLPYDLDQSGFMPLTIVSGSALAPSYTVFNRHTYLTWLTPD